MKFSDNYIFYPVNPGLVKAINHYKRLSGDIPVAGILPDTNITEQDNFLYTRGNFEQHHLAGNNLDLAVEYFEQCLQTMPADADAEDRAQVQNSLGCLLGAVGQQRMDENCYQKAANALTQALEVFTEADFPQQWADTQYNLATVLQAVGRQTDNAKMLKASVDAYTEALRVRTREEMPDEWALTLLQLGNSFAAHGRLLRGNRTLQKSVVAYKNALTHFDADNHPLELAATHNARGAVLHNLAESEENPDRMLEAIKSYETGLTVCMEQQRPIHLAVLCRVNRSTARLVLAAMRKDPVLAEESADEFELIVECFPHALQPLCRKHCENSMEAARGLAAELC